MPSVLRRLVFFLIVTLLVNVGGWTFNGAAMADILRDAQLTAADVMQGEPESAPSDPAASPCNHWCHAIGHFVGLPTALPDVPPAVGGERIPLDAYSISSAQGNGLYRPPRFNS